MGKSTWLPSGQKLVPLELSYAALTDLLMTRSQDFAPVRFDTYVNGTDWILNNWSIPVSTMLTQFHTSNESVLIAIQLDDVLDVTVSQLRIQADEKSKDVDVSLVFNTNAVAGMKELVEIHVSGMKTTFEDGWLRQGVKLNQLMFDETTVMKLELETAVTIQHVVIRHSNLSFPTSVLGLETRVATLILEHNTIAGPIVLTESEYVQLSRISDFRATANTIDTPDDGSALCIKTRTIRDLGICIVDDVQSTDASCSDGSDGSVEQTTGPLETLSASTSSNRGVSSIIVIVLSSTCTLVLVVVVSFFRRFKRKASKLADGRLTSSNREHGLLAGQQGETERSEVTVTGVTKILADMDLGKNQVMLYKKLGVQGLWLGEYKDTKVVALKFAPRDLKMSTKELNAIRMSYVPLRHDNVVYFLGSSWTDCAEALIVVEHMSMGSLRLVLADEKIDLAWPTRLQMSKNICSGLSFVRSMKRVKLSRNLTAKSVLLNAQFVCKMDIFDYALSLRTDLVPVRSYGDGEIASRAPELLKGNKITAAAEVYALGIIFCEISLRSKLFQRVFEERGPTMGDICIATEVVAQRLKPLPAQDAPADFKKLALRCISYEPSQRPALSEVLRSISR
ncbi:unnamed protein product [Peronospora belbahrii]|uniref:Protein kinase domain-containing protein n=1 Tax=Peronospora belbahrii TaxID=622444 RepID=A0ABN8CTH2_9STRA|nr:unnamed protein product [Peronospora belbahrii]